MKLHVLLTLLLVGLLNFALALPANSTDLSVPHPVDADDATPLNETTDFEADYVIRNPAPGWCTLNINMVEHFPRGVDGVPGGRRASISVGGVWDNSSKAIQWAWSDGTPAVINGFPSERRIDTNALTIFHIIHKGDWLRFSWHHYNRNSIFEWIQIDYWGTTWSDIVKDCKTGHCCQRGDWHPDGKNRLLRGVACGFACP
ncbi:hypothetical protein C7974DRAFT_211931 [Boeremia exigua]|uniref:uncharacterized protein n=1 Tax=Boeremia exigua TaxID=749465 RepID=UPI001E8E64C5|nr:uncharacterized protein C7974DRAFT_211931 [Boeremia exigua]KAH6621840.1 hypothetical protein C7974DRAFT_211931 [Boeremia exigua]